MNDSKDHKTAFEPPLGCGVMPPALDFAGDEVPRNCENCQGIYDDSDGPEYGPPWMRCSLKPHMENLRGFPFKTPQKCFEIAWWHMVDWEAEGRKLDQECEQQGHNALGNKPPTYGRLINDDACGRSC